MGTFTWSDEQVRIFSHFADPDKGNLIVRARAGTGKCLGKNTPVMLHDGRITPVQYVKTGDLLMGPDSKPREVCSTSVGFGPLYRITPVKGDPWVCNYDHIMTLAGTNSKMGEVVDISLRDLVSKNRGRLRIDRTWKLMRTGIDFEEQEVYVDPYLFGVWIGDGTKGEPQITNCDPEIIDYCCQIALKYGLEVVLRHEKQNNTFNIRFRSGTVETAKEFNFLRGVFRSIGDKYIPACYLHNTSDIRLQLLAGIVDTDGHLSTGGYEVITVSNTLSEQILYLARSLGFAAYSSKKIGTIKSLNFSSEYNRIFISGDVDRIPVKVARKKCSPRQQIKRWLVTGFEADYIGEGDYYGFTLSGDGRFLLGDFTVTHNTTTILSAVSKATWAKNIVLCAFNKRIAEELKDKCTDPRCEIATLHSIGFRFMRGWGEGRLRVDKWREYNIAEKIGIDDKDEKSNVAKLAVKIKEIDPWADVDGVVDMAYRFDCLPSVKKSDAAIVDIAHRAMRVCELSLEYDGTVSFADMLYMPVMLGLACPTWDFGVVDEVQDMGPIQIQLAKMIIRPEGRFAGVGDDRQGIYGFRGADVGTIDILKEELHADELGLTVTYRCPKKIVEYAQRLVPDYKVADTAPEGVIDEIIYPDIVNHAGPGDFILSRTNAPLMKVCLKLLREGIKARIQGRNIGEDLTRICKKLEPISLEDLVEKLDVWSSAECERALKRKGRSGEARREQVLDTHETLMALIQDTKDLDTFFYRLKDLFDEMDGKSPLVVCSTVHKAKGLEARRVFILRSTLYPGPNAKESIEEQNIEYVAVTRAMERLTWVNG